MEAKEVLADVQAALQQDSLPQSAHKFITDVLHGTQHQNGEMGLRRSSLHWDGHINTRIYGMHQASQYIQ